MRSSLSRNGLLLTALVGALLHCHPVAADESKTGEQIYRKQCASCHGTSGEGTKKCPDPLVGDRSTAQLSKYIAKSMPEDNPGTCVGEDADKVAAYIFDAFYSKAARERNKPPRIELARLTVKQYRNAAADLIGSFRFNGNWGDKRGLRGEYFNARNFRNDKRILDRTDPAVKFDFADKSPEEGKIEAREFCIRWSGSVLAPETGEYTFVVRCDHAIRLWINDINKPLIDAWVKSGSDTEFRETIFLLGGRVYPLKLEFSKAKQGVDKSDKEKEKPPAKAFIALEWKTPHHPATEIIPARNLSPNNFPESFVLANPFPPDDRSYGWERGTTISKAWDQATTDAAIDIETYALSKLNDLAKTKEKDKDREKKIRDFCQTFAERAFRKPLNAELKKVYIDHPFEGAKDLELAAKRSMVLVLKSPRFLYREVSGTPDAYDTAARLSFALWDSLPDDALWKAAQSGKLTTREQVSAQAERMLADPRAQAKLREFLLHWLRLDQAPEITKDAKRFPGFDPAMVADLRTSLELSLNEAVISKESDFRQLLLSEDFYMNGRLAKFYGADLPAEADFQKAKLPTQHRMGILSHPYLLSTYAYNAETSPIHRGVFLARGILGIALRPPQEAFVPFSAESHPNLTTRERVSLQTKSTQCLACHNIINPLGFTLENFDAVGRFRDKENTKPIDSKGSYLTKTGEQKNFANVQELSKFLADSPDVHTAFTEQMFHHLVQQAVRAYGPKTLEELRQKFTASGFNIRKLAVEIVTTAALTSRDAQATITSKTNDHTKE